MTTSSRKKNSFDVFPLNKTRVVTWLTNVLLFKPGPLDWDKFSWICSPKAVLCFIGMAITVGNLLAVIALQRGPDHDDDGPEGYEGGSENNEGCPMPPPPPPEFEGGNHTGTYLIYKYIY